MCIASHGFPEMDDGKHCQESLKPSGGNNHAETG
jgi:hypothetical protein